MAKKDSKPFYQKLILNQYMLSLFGQGKTFATVTANMKSREAEGLDADDGVTKFLKTIEFSQYAPLSYKQLLPYDANIRAHTNAIQGNRPQPIAWKYFQYMALLFSEIYLDKYCHDADGLLKELNNFARHYVFFTRDDLRKIAFWSATGSGKTLIMHVNIKQYLHYFGKAGGRHRLNNILLITPNEGLSQQHKQEFDASHINADFFNKKTGRLLNDAVQIIEITKFAEKDGDKKVAIEAFEGNNLVLVDEGHRGASGKEWMAHRKNIAKQGFTFEYSATLGQAVAGKQELEQEYSKAILFDYSYPHFYSDGFGKDYQIFNLKDERNYETKNTYLLTCLLSFYQQKYLYRQLGDRVRQFQIDNPLWVFVGSKVTAVRKQSGKDVSDVVDILQFLAWFISDTYQHEVQDKINAIIADNTGMANESGHHVFADIVPHLEGLIPTEIYRCAMRDIFHAEHGGALHIEQLKGTDGEIALRVGENDIFGIINVGDAAKLCKLCAEHDEFIVSDKNFTDSLFHNINHADSSINMLIGAKKFTEGWNSWRVSVMGLMNVGRGEGSEIIQLFGRGVRLRGYQNTLKRHRHLEAEYDTTYSPELAQLEQLNIFGIRSDYMESFRKELVKEGIDVDEKVTIVLPTFNTPNIALSKLRTIRLKDGLNYQHDGDALILCHDANVPRVTLDYYPKLQALASDDIGDASKAISKHDAKIRYRDWLDIDVIYFDLHAYKCAQEWHNFLITKQAIRELLAKDDWYELLMPDQAKKGFDLELWQNIANDLLRKYAEKFYRYQQNKWEAPHREYVTLTKDDKNFVREYQLRIKQDRENIVNQLRKIEGELKKGDVPTIDSFGNNKVIAFDRHLYQPLLYKDKNETIDIQPVALNEGEKQFVENLIGYCRDIDKEIYLLRNMSRGKGLGFFEAGNFYPDFILWVLAGDKQSINFIDPKGLRNLRADNPKITFHKTIKDIQREMGDSNITLDSFIISGTKRSDLVADYEADDVAHILFPNEKNYLAKIFANNIS